MITDSYRFLHLFCNALSCLVLHSDCSQMHIFIVAQGVRIEAHLRLHSIQLCVSQFCLSMTYRVFSRL